MEGASLKMRKGQGGKANIEKDVERFQKGVGRMKRLSARKDWRDDGEEHDGLKERVRTA